MSAVIFSRIPQALLNSAKPVDSKQNYQKTLLMNRRLKLLLGAALLLGLVSTVSAQLPSKPNVIFILADDMGYRSLSDNYRRGEVTPQLDRLAADGVNFTQAYVTHAYCGPSRAGIMAGRYQQHFGFESNPAFNDEDLTLGFPKNEVMLSETMKARGYATSCIGKWHLGGSPEHHPMERGFDEFYGFLHGDANFFTIDEHHRNDFLRREHQEVKRVSYLTDDFTDAAVDFIARKKDEPFFIYLAYNAVHGPFQASQEYLDRVAHLPASVRIHVAMLLAMDDGIGRIRAELERQGLTDDTLIIFTNDNGGHTADHGFNAPLNGKKGQVLEGGIRVPFLMAWPGVIRPNQRHNGLVSTLDVFATSAAVAGATRADYRKTLDGVNLLNFVRRVDGTPPTTGNPHPRLFWRDGGGWRWCVRSGDYKLLGGRDSRVVPDQLYNIRQDISETNNLYNRPEFRGVRDRLLREYNTWNAKNIDRNFENNVIKPNPITLNINSPSAEEITVRSLPATISLVGAASHSRNRRLTSEWTVSDESAVTFTGRRSFRPSLRINRAGDYTVRLTVTDGEFIKSREFRINATPTPLPVDRQIITLKSSLANSYISAERNAPYRVDAEAPTPGIAEKWQVTRFSNGHCALRNLQTGRYLGMRGDGSLRADLTGAATSLPNTARFLLVARNGFITIAPASNLGAAIRANRARNGVTTLRRGSQGVARAQQFTWNLSDPIMPVPGQKVWVRNRSTNSFLQAEPGGRRRVTLNGQARFGSNNLVDDRALWTVTRSANGSFALRNDETGQHLAMDTRNSASSPGNLRASFAADPATSSWARFAFRNVGGNVFAMRPEFAGAGWLVANAGAPRGAVATNGSFSTDRAGFSWGPAIEHFPVAVPSRFSFANDGSTPQPPATGGAVPQVGDVIWLRSVSAGRYLTPVGRTVGATATSITDASRWRVVNADGAYVSLRNVASNQLVGLAGLSNRNISVATRATVDNWNSIQFTAHGGGQISVQTKPADFGIYAVDGSQANTVRANGAAGNRNTRFTWGTSAPPAGGGGSTGGSVPQVGDIISLQYATTSRYVSSGRWGNTDLRPSQGSVEANEQWRIVGTGESPYVGLQNVATGRYAIFLDTNVQDPRTTYTHTTGRPFPNWAKFEFVSYPDGRIGIGSKPATFGFLRAETAKGQFIITATGTRGAANTQFRWARVGGTKRSLSKSTVDQPVSEDTVASSAAASIGSPLSAIDATAGDAQEGPVLDLAGLQTAELTEQFNFASGYPRIYSETIEGVSSLVFEYLQLKDESELAYPLVSTNMLVWNGAEGEETVVSYDENWNHFKVVVPTPEDPNVRLFGQVKMVVPAVTADSTFE